MADRLNAAELLIKRLIRNAEEIEQEEGAGSYSSLLHDKREAYQQSGVPISEDEAKELVRLHPFMPSPSNGKLDKKALQK